MLPKTLKSHKKKRKKPSVALPLAVLARQRKTKRIFLREFATGMTIEEAAKVAGVCSWTIWNYRKQYAPFNTRVENIIESRVQDIEDALVKTSKGYVFIESHQEKHTGGKDGLKIVKKRIRKHIQPSVHAIKYYLDHNSDKYKEVDLESSIIAERLADFISAMEGVREEAS